MPKFIVIEIQTNADGTIGNLVTSYDSRNAAESSYHTVLASAAISALPKHAAVLLTNDGTIINSECYEHEGVPTPEGE